jgi:hypothetical protein
MTANREFKSSVFATLFGEPEKFIELYNALTGGNYPKDTPMEPATLTNALIMDRQNDIAYILDERIVVLLEHQSSINENMPLRILIYLSRIYEMIIDNKVIYQEELVKIPRPEFIVLYNGVKAFPNEKILRLSDAFKQRAGQEDPGLGSFIDLRVRVVNVNEGYNEQIIKGSKNLGDYVTLVSQIRRWQQNGLSLGEAVSRSVKDCISQGILPDFLKKHASEVINMLFAEFKMEDALEMRWAEGLAKGLSEGLAEGLERGKFENAKQMLQDNLPMDKITQYTGLSRDQVEGIEL